MADDLHDKSEILDLPDTPSMTREEQRRVILVDPWSDLSTAYIGEQGYCRVQYDGKIYRGRVYKPKR